jgi:hypothetical protein
LIFEYPEAAASSELILLICSRQADCITLCIRAFGKQGQALEITPNTMIAENLHKIVAMLAGAGVQLAEGHGRKAKRVVEIVK